MAGIHLGCANYPTSIRQEMLLVKLCHCPETNSEQLEQ
jgi:hypothetical protein